jgi:hypothetical protein
MLSTCAFIMVLSHKIACSAGGSSGSRGLKAKSGVILSDVPVRLGPKDLSYSRDDYRICEVGAPPSRDPSSLGMTWLINCQDESFYNA